MNTDSTIVDLKERIRHVLAAEVEPALQMPAGGIQVLDVTDGIVRLRLGDICASCPSSIMVVIMELEQELRKRIPEVAYLEAVP
jgi:Fe-S cluster biogenesis protein NfuA